MEKHYYIYKAKAEARKKIWQKCHLCELTDFSVLQCYP